MASALTVVRATIATKAKVTRARVLLMNFDMMEVCGREEGGGDEEGEGRMKLMMKEEKKKNEMRWCPD